MGLFGTGKNSKVTSLTEHNERLTEETNRLREQVEALSSKGQSSINQMMRDVREIMSALRTVHEEFNADEQKLRDGLKLISSYSQKGNDIIAHLSIIGTVIQLCDRDTQDLGQILQLTASWNQKWGGNIDPNTFRVQSEEFRQIRMLYNRHEIHHKALTQRLPRTSDHTRQSYGGKSINEIAKEGQDLASSLELLGNLLAALRPMNDELSTLTAKIGDASGAIKGMTTSVASKVNSAVGAVEKLDQLAIVVNTTVAQQNEIQKTLSKRLKNNNYELVNDKSKSDYGSYVRSPGKELPTTSY